MLKFSEKMQSFYDFNLNYPTKPDDLVDVTKDQYDLAYRQIKNGCYIFKDLTASQPKPSFHHKFVSGKWVDGRTENEKLSYEMSRLLPLTRRQFRLALVTANYKLSDIEVLIENIVDNKLKQIIQIEWEDAQIFERNSESLNTVAKLLGLNDSQINELWKIAESF